jgi:outer membrane protein with beta-barrel domain
MRSSFLVRALAVPLALAGLAPGAARAQASLGIGGGATIPVGDFNTSYSTGYNILTTLDIHAPRLPIRFRIDGMFNHLSGRATQFGTQVAQSQVWTVNGNVAVDLRLAPGMPLVPYVIAGLGYYNDQSGLIGTRRSGGDFGVNGGAGLRVPLPGITLFAEGRYHRVYTPGTRLEMIPITAGVMLGR